MQRRQFLGSLAAAGLASAQRGNRPNIVFVLVDDLRWDALGYAGHPFVKTPNIDRIAKEGAIFENAFVTTPLCSPARGSFLTGQYVRSHGVRGNGDNAALSHKMITFPRLLHDAGYATGYFGKWHMGNDDSPRPGMDRWVSFRGQGQYEDPPLNIDGQQVAAKGYITDLLSDHAAAFIRKQNASKPFCVYLAHKAIHGPFTPAARHVSLYADAVIRRAANAQDNLAGKPMLTRELPAAPEKKAAKKKGAPVGPGDELVRNQMRCLTAIDEGLGRVLQALEETKALANTLIIFTSDNGYFWGEHGLGDKRAAYEESIRIPMAARYPPLLKAGTRINSMVLNIDIAQTMLAAAGVAAHKQMQGRSMLPLFAGKTSGWRQHFLCEYYMEQNFARVASWEAVRTARHKYIHYFDLKDMDELYDLQSDPGELKNLIAEPSAKSTLADMQKLLDTYRKQVRV